MTNNGEGLFGVRYGADVYKSVNQQQPDNSPPPYQHHQPPSSSGTGGGIDVSSQAVAMHGLNMNMNMNVVVEGGSSEHHQHQQPMSAGMMMMKKKKKRGRPRKYGGGVTDGTMSLALMPPTATATTPPPPSSSQAATATATATASGGGTFSSPTSSFKKARGRPPGSTNKNTTTINKLHQPPLLGSAGFGFTPHVISVKAGEDVSSKIMSFSQNGPRAVCILSANGSISNVTLRQAATSGGTATYEGRFEILSLCGSFLLTEIAGQRSRTGGLSVSLAGPDGRVLGGCVAGLLTAASPVQVIVGSFIPDGGRKESKVGTQNHHTEPSAAQMSSPPQNPMPMSMQAMVFKGGSFGTSGVSESSHGGSLSDSSGGEGSSPGGNHHHHNNNNNNNNNNQPQGLMGMPWR